MKRKIIIIVIIISAIFGLGGTYYILNHSKEPNGPSSEMILLRDVEANLDLAKTASQRSENDKGCYRDYKGAPHCVRSIFFYYKSNLYWQELHSKLLDGNWKIFDLKDGHQRASKNINGNWTCMIYGEAFSEPGSSATLLASTDDRCQYILKHTEGISAQ